MTSHPATDTSDRDFRHSRFIAASPVQVFAAIATPERLARWWGPTGFSSTFESCDFRPGGDWRFMLHSPDGQSFPNHNVFREIVPNERVVIEHIDMTHHFVLTITLTPQDGGTLVGWHQLFDGAEHRHEIAVFVTPANEQNLDRLTGETVAPTG